MTEPYRIWTLDAPFDKDGVPVMGTVGRSVERVVVIRSQTFRRMIAEHPSLRTAAYEVGSYDED